MADEKPPAFRFEGEWPFGGDVTVNGHVVQSVSSWSVQADADGIPVVTLHLVGPGALALILGSDAARVQAGDETREALIAMGWTPPRA